MAFIERSDATALCATESDAKMKLNNVTAWRSVGHDGHHHESLQ